MNTTIEQQEIDFTRINKDVNGNPRYVCHWLVFNTDTYEQALILARKIGGRKFHNKQYGGGIVFQSYSLPQLTKAINETKNA